MCDADHWVRDYFNAYYANENTQPQRKSKHSRRAKSSVCTFASKETRHSKVDEIQQEILNLRKILSFRDDDSQAYELKQQPSKSLRATLY